MEPRLLDLCRRLIATRSVTSEGTRTIAEFCAREILAPAGVAVQLIPSRHEGPDQVNLLGFIAGREPGLAPLVLSTHLDTVPPGDASMWTECDGAPFLATVKGDRIYGLGAADTKLDFAAKMTAVIESGQPRRDVYLAGTFGEEHGLTGAKELCEAGAFPPGALAFVGEPSRLQVITAHKGLMVFELAVRFTPLGTGHTIEMRQAVFAGRSAHSSTPALGENAIIKALGVAASRPKLHVAAMDGGDAVNKVPARCELIVPQQFAGTLGASAVKSENIERSEFIPAEAIAALSQFVRDLKDFADRSGSDEPDFAAPTLTCNPGVIHTRDDTTVIVFELRPPPSLALDEVRRGVSSIVQRLSAGAPNLDIELSETRANPGFRSPPASETVELAMAAMARAGLELETGVKAGCTEAGIYATQLMPVVFGPGQSTGVVHAPNEYNFLTEVEAALRFYQTLISS